MLKFLRNIIKAQTFNRSTYDIMKPLESDLISRISLVILTTIQKNITRNECNNDLE
jgi:hypothetical protein